MFSACDSNADPAAAQAACSALARMAAETGATVLAAHHFRKSEKPIKTAADARAAIRGTTGLVDGVRAVYALWTVPDEKADNAWAGLLTACPPLVYGALVKTNDAPANTIHTYARQRDGSLRDVSKLARDMRPLTQDRHLVTDEMLADLVAAVAAEAEFGRPFTKTGKSGVDQRRERLPESFTDVPRRKLLTAVDLLLSEGRIVQAIAGRSSQPQWLDVPDGDFARGEGEFAPGATR